MMEKKVIERTIKALERQLGIKLKKEQTRVKTGVNQVAKLWSVANDGDAKIFSEFCLTHFYSGRDLDVLFERLEVKGEYIRGYFGALTLQLRRELDEDRGPLAAYDLIFAGFSPAAHLANDFFANKLAFVVLLNFELHSLPSMLKLGVRWSRRKWAESRLVAGYQYRVPAEIGQLLAQVYARASSYINGYNIHMDHLIQKGGKTIFPQGMKLISHWGLRDEVKALYANPAGNLSKQEMIQTIMERIIRQEIPAEVIDKPAVWDPITNLVAGKPSKREPDVRYEHLLCIFKAHQREDMYYPGVNSHIARRFELSREIPESEVEAMLTRLLRSPAAAGVGKLVAKRLGRDLRPFDIWYHDFSSGGLLAPEKLDALVKKLFKGADDFERAIPDILGKLGFDKKTAKFLGDHIAVDRARGAGHAYPPAMRGEKARLRSRFPAQGMDYKSFNIAMHELGHNVEQVFSLYRVDHNLLSSVPNTAFTEGFAFVFQARDLDILGVKAGSEHLDDWRALKCFWATREIAGVSLVDMRVWRWMYAHPTATKASLKEAVITIAVEVWNTYFAKVFGVEDCPILAIYSHMIDSGMYLPDYPLGHIIAYQIENYFKTHALARQMERMCKLGSVTPDEWMRQAVMSKISEKPLLVDVKGALKRVGI